MSDFRQVRKLVAFISSWNQNAYERLFTLHRASLSGMRCYCVLHTVRCGWGVVALRYRVHRLKEGKYLILLLNCSQGFTRSVGLARALHGFFFSLLFFAWFSWEGHWGVSSSAWRSAWSFASRESDNILFYFAKQLMDVEEGVLRVVFEPFPAPDYLFEAP